MPSITELLCELGLAEQLVGRTGFCVHPSELVRHIPKLGGTKQVKLDRLRALRPTHVVVNVDENQRETVEALAQFVAHVVVTDPRGPRDNLELYRLLGGLFGREREAERLCQSFETAFAETVTSTRARRNVLYLIWREPWMTVAPDTYISRMLALFNWHTRPETASQRYPVIELEAFAGQVDHVLLASEPYHFKERHIAEIEAAVAGARVSLIDGHMTSWYGSRAIDGLYYLSDCAEASEEGDCSRLHVGLPGRKRYRGEPRSGCQ